MTSKTRFILFLMGWVAMSCGGPAKTMVTASVAIPFDLLAVESYEPVLTLNDPLTGSVIQGPTALVRDEINSTWNAELVDIDERDYVAVVEISVRDASGALTLARASRDISINKGAPFATLTFKPSDFDAGLDDDNDAVFNVNEYLNGLNPHDEDTDHDGVLDFDEIAPIAEVAP